ncbi:ACT domain-containing protein [Veillonella criceti]|uniref:Uncharacterized conserved protein n=1 Tax=Veillonella criceti TaxID=103891 RepID=A0A380NKG4_9FIRM|nr:ACT domain-containing protein [Veillonella criceti]SUP41673.1 Uncharacterized conserved protein [Veillonella criceti]
MQLKVIKNTLAVCKVADYSDVNWQDEFVFIGKTDEENSLVCSVKYVPQNATQVDTTWRAVRIEGELDFALIGILSKLSTILAEAKIGIFAVSTYNTDYILVKEENFENALTVLSQNGYEISR